MLISTETDLKNASLKMYNLLGQEVRSVKNLNGNAVVLSRDNLQAGAYILSLQNENTVINRKIIIAD